MPDKPFFIYFAPGATHAPHHVPPEWSDKYKGKFDDGWDALREETFARQKELGVIPADAELTERPEEIPAWDDMPEDLKPVLARQMEVYAGFLEHTDHHVGRLDRRARRPRDPRRHARLLHHRRQRRVRRGHAERLLQRARRPQRRGRARDHRVHGLAHRRLRHTGGLQPLRGRLGARDGHAVPVDEAGRVALGRHAQRHHRPLARGHQGTRRDPLAVPPRDRRRPDRARGGRPSGAVERQRRPAAAARRRLAWPTRSTTRKADERHTTQYFEMFCNRGIYHQGWTAVTRHSTPWVATETAGLRRRRLGALRPRRLDPGPRPRRRAAREARRAPAPLPDRGGQVQRAAARRPSLRAVQPRPRRSAAAGARESSQLLFGGMGRLSENSVVTIKNKSLLDHGGGGRARGRRRRRDHRPGRRLRRLAPLRRRMASRRTATTSSACSGSRSTGTARSRRARTRCGWSSPTTVAGSARAATSRSTSTASRSASGRVDGTVPMLFSADETTDVGADTATPVSDDYSARAARSRARSTGCRSTSTTLPKTPTT